MLKRSVQFFRQSTLFIYCPIDFESLLTSVKLISKAFDLHKFFEILDILGSKGIFLNFR